ncbi:MAG: hypothetical protein LBV04_05550 [Deferribacteraceae bacterium]|jgi:hypothetical protein|nr:hypothetical protein [Deferribacteraceae bacterium]
MNNTPKEELQKVVRIADQLCSMHAFLCQKYKYRNVMVEVSCIIVSIWLVMMAFIQPEIAFKIYPSIFPPNIWIGILSFLVCGLSVFHIIVDWRGKAQSHQQASTLLSSFKKEYRKNSDDNIAEEAILRYNLLTDSLISIPEKYFLPLKRKHLIKVAVSRHLSNHPATCILLFKLKLWYADNMSKKDE